MPDDLSRRPKVRSGSEKRQRQRVIPVRVDDAEALVLEVRSSESGLSPPAYLRACGLGAAGPRAKRRPPIDRELLARTNADLNRIGNNVNQIAKGLNIGRSTEAAVILIAMDELRGTLRLIRQALGYDSQG
jgi:hypothetical protein